MSTDIHVRKIDDYAFILSPTEEEVDEYLDSEAGIKFLEKAEKNRLAWSEYYQKLLAKDERVNTQVTLLNKGKRKRKVEFGLDEMTIILQPFNSEFKNKEIEDVEDMINMEEKEEIEEVNNDFSLPKDVLIHEGNTDYMDREELEELEEVESNFPITSKVIEKEQTSLEEVEEKPKQEDKPKPTKFYEEKLF